MEGEEEGAWDTVARWFEVNLATTFFTSLVRCSCIYLSTDDKDDALLPLPSLSSSSSSTSSNNIGGREMEGEEEGAWDTVARWFEVNLATTFFTSLVRCSCIYLSTDDKDDALLPLPSLSSSSSSTSSNNIVL
ncbi:hypothetical protein DEO72_LG11g2569 [Vigna unguiculata]|uniref:Uncharacterized protein n=1 Tax=Vigna unguiculata TaxID=3917 RepID=A0A4D6NQB5_VIGUN|nr:hypothetical protein DEO72_LG11g2569 [Vigna unguiculata]